MTGTEQTFDDMMAALDWKPIAAYDRATGPEVLFRSGSDGWVIGFFGERKIFCYEDGSYDFDVLPDLGPMFRHAQDAVMGEPLGFEPSEFATLDEEWRWCLMED